MLVSLSGSPRYQDEELRFPAHAAFQRMLLESRRDLQCRSSMVPWLLPQVVLSVLQNARSCAEVARAVLGIKSREDAAALWRPGRQVLPVQCCGLLAVACKADSARCVFLVSATNGCGTCAGTAGSCASCSLKSGMVICGSRGRPLAVGPAEERGFLCTGMPEKGGNDCK